MASILPKWRPFFFPDNNKVSLKVLILYGTSAGYQSKTMNTETE
jgi:hypothetical protein